LDVSVATLHSLIHYRRTNRSYTWPPPLTSQGCWKIYHSHVPSRHRSQEDVSSCLSNTLSLHLSHGDLGFTFVSLHFHHVSERYFYYYCNNTKNRHGRAEIEFMHLHPKLWKKIAFVLRCQIEGIYLPRWIDLAHPLKEFQIENDIWNFQNLGMFKFEIDEIKVLFDSNPYTYLKDDHSHL
jgi:hypothetical protein